MELLMFKEDSKCGKFGDKIISFFTRSKYSHVAVIVSGVMYEAHISNGVTMSRDRKLIDECWDRYQVKLDGKNKNDLINIINKLEKEGRRKTKYSIIGAILSLFHINFRREDKLFCSEYIAYGFGLSRSASFTPQRLFEELKRIKRI